jgi:hypothetical protein
MDGLEKRDAGEPTERRSTDLQIETERGTGPGVSGRKVEGVTRLAFCQSAGPEAWAADDTIKSANSLLCNTLGRDCDARGPALSPPS